MSGPTLRTVVADTSALVSLAVPRADPNTILDRSQTHFSLC